MSRQRWSSGRAGLTALVTLISVSVGLSGCASPAAPTPSLASSAVSASTGSSDDGSSGRPAAGSTTAPLAPPSGTGTGVSSASVAPALAGASAADLEQATADVSQLSLPRLAAQIVVPRQSGSGATAAQPVRSQGYGGVAVFSANIPRSAAAIPTTVRATNTALQAAMRQSGRDWPAFIAIDQEGGPVTRIGSPLTTWPAAMALGAAGDAALAAAVARASGAELRGLGFTVVMAPVADVTIGPADPTIGVRSPGTDPGTVATVATAMVAGYTQAGIMPTVKHFPGHGSVSADTHAGTVIQSASREVLDRRDLLPFARLAASGAPAVMVAHIVVRAVDANQPATLSGAVVDGVLRRDLGFRGMTVTDALEMAAVSRRYGPGEAAVRAVLAGNDVLLMPADPAQAVAGLVKAVNQGRLPKARLEQAAARMVAGLRASVRAAPADHAPGSHRTVADRLAAASITQLGGRCGTRLVGKSLSFSGPAAAVSAMTAAARTAGLRVGGGTTVLLLTGSSAPRGTAAADVVVALNSPYALRTARARSLALATYGATPATYRALASVLAGTTTPRGQLPVAVGAWPIGTGCR